MKLNPYNKITYRKLLFVHRTHNNQIFLRTKKLYINLHATILYIYFRGCILLKRMCHRSMVNMIYKFCSDWQIRILHSRSRPYFLYIFCKF